MDILFIIGCVVFVAMIIFAFIPWPKEKSKDTENTVSLPKRKPLDIEPYDRDAKWSLEDIVAREG